MAGANMMNTYLVTREIKREIDSAEEEADAIASTIDLDKPLKLVKRKPQNGNSRYPPMGGIPPSLHHHPPGAGVTGRCITLGLGQTFRSFSEVSDAVRNYELENRVHLTAKYFRRIAANPKPSNKEDYMLTVEERKRFVYRWVDFCCTFFDGAIAGSEQRDPVPGPAVGFSAKECPMRIRFQLRTKEKDLIVSTCKESHEHDDPTLPNLPTTNPSLVPSQILSTAKLKMNMESIMEDDPKPKVRRPIPSLNALPGASTSAHARESIPLGDTTRTRPSTTISTTKLTQNFIPKPPPLRRGVAVVGPAISTVTGGSISNARNANARQFPPRPDPRASPSPTSLLVGLSARTVIMNLYNYLLQTRNEGAEPDTIGFVSPNANLIKLTAKMSGVDEKYVFQIVHGKRLFRTPVPSNARSGNQIQIRNSAVMRKRQLGMLHKPQQQHQFRRNIHANATPRLKGGSVRYEQQHTNNTTSNHSGHSRDNDESSAFNLPLEVIIKTEPEPADYNDATNGDEYEDDGADNNEMDFEGGSFDFSAAYSTR